MEVIDRMDEQIQALKDVIDALENESMETDGPNVLIDSAVVAHIITQLKEAIPQIKEIYDDQCIHADALQIEVDELIEEVNQLTYELGDMQEEVNQLTYELGDLQTEHEESILDDRTI